MIEVGSNAGVANTQQQGVGRATILQGDGAVDTYSRLWAVDQAAQARRDQERQAKRGAAMTALKTFKPDWFYKHDGEMSTALNDHFNKGAELLARIDDPFTSNDPAAVEFQKEHARIQAMSNASMQVKEQFGMLQKQMATADPNDFDARSLDGAVKYFDTPLSKIVESGSTAPVLMKKKPALDTMDFMAKRMGTWQSTSGAIPTDNEVREFTRGLMSDPANRDQIVTGYGSRMAQMDADEKKALEDRARMSGAEPAEQLMFEDAKKFQKRREAFDLQKELKAAAGMAEGGIDYTEWNTPEGFGKAPKKGSKEAAIKASVDATFNSDPRWLEVYDREGELPRGQEETDGEYAKRVKVYMAKQIDPLVGISTKSGRTDKGGKDIEQEKTRNAFVSDMRSGDWVKAQGAANVLVGTKFANNLDIQNATITQGPEGFRLELDLGTNVTTKDVRDQITDPNTGLSSDKVNVEQRQGRQVVTVDLAEGAISNQTLARLIDNTIKEGGRYDPSLTEKSPETAIEAARISVPGAPTAKKTTVDMDFFK